MRFIVGQMPTSFGPTLSGQYGRYHQAPPAAVGTPQHQKPSNAQGQWSLQAKRLGVEVIDSLILSTLKSDTAGIVVCAQANQGSYKRHSDDGRHEDHAEHHQTRHQSGDEKARHPTSEILVSMLWTRSGKRRRRRRRRRLLLNVRRCWARAKQS